MDLVKNLQDIILRRRSLIVCDENTVELIPKSLFNLKNLQFIRLYRPLASKALSIALIPHLKCKDLIIAFGTGTITDICKYAASITNKSYIVFPTAPSVIATDQRAIRCPCSNPSIPPSPACSACHWPQHAESTDRDQGQGSG